MSSSFKNLFLIPTCVLTVAFFQGCDKHRAKKLSGTYACEVKYHYWDMSGPTVVDSVYAENLEVVRDGKSVKVLNYVIHSDALQKGKEYREGDVHNYITLRFTEDSIYFFRSSGGLGGNASFAYSGKK